MYATLTVRILGEKIKHVSIKRAIGGYANRRDSIHLLPRGLGLAPAQ